jgi:hypothetical protein
MQTEHIALRQCKRIKRTMRQRANGISAMDSLCSYSVCTLTHRALDPFARPHSDTIYLVNVLLYNVRIIVSHFKFLHYTLYALFSTF